MTIRAVVVAACLACFVVPPASVSLFTERQEDEEVRAQLLLAPYQECLSLFRRGQPAEAVAKLREFDRERLAAILRRVRERTRAFPPGFDTGDVQAAILLHVEAVRREHVLPGDRGTHLAAAWTIASAARGRIPATFVRDCHLLVLWSLQYQFELDDLVRQLDIALHRFPGDGELVLVQGSLWELLARLQDPGLRVPLNNAVRDIASMHFTQFAPDYDRLDVAAPGVHEKCARLYGGALRQPSLPSRRPRSFVCGCRTSWQWRGCSARPWKRSPRSTPRPCPDFPSS